MELLNFTRRGIFLKKVKCESRIESFTKFSRTYNGEALQLIIKILNEIFPLI